MGAERRGQLKYLDLLPTRKGMSSKIHYFRRVPPNAGETVIPHLREFCERLGVKFPLPTQRLIWLFETLIYFKTHDNLNIDLIGHPEVVMIENDVL